MRQILTSIERESLLRRHKKERNAKIRDRLKAVLAYDEGYSYSEISRILLLDDETIRRHINEYLSTGKLKSSSGEVAHQIINTSHQSLKYLCLSTTESHDIIEYPDSKKIMCLTKTPDTTPLRKIFKSSDEVEYLEGEGD